MIYVLIGPSCSGKTTALEALKEKGFKTIISYTTRPQRENEVDGANYHFITEKEYFRLDKKNKLIAKFSPLTVFGRWYYGINKDDVDLKDKLVVIAEPSGYQDLINTFGPENVCGIYFKAGFYLRLERSKARQDDKNEMRRRLASDESDFRNFDKRANFILDAALSKEELLEQVINIIEGSKNE